MDGLSASTEPNPLTALGHPSGRSPFPPIADYAFLSDCEATCLVAPSGAVEWMCLPRPDSPSVFSAMLDRRAITAEMPWRQCAARHSVRVAVDRDHRTVRQRRDALGGDRFGFSA